MLNLNWTDANRSYSFNGRQLKIRIELGKNEMLRQFKITETIILEDNIEDIDRLYNEETSLVNKEKEIKLKELNDKIDEEKRKELLQIYEDYRRRQKIGFAFSLKDDYEPDQESHYKGYSGELYLYLNSLDENSLLKIFDELNDKIIILKGDVNMKMDGPQGMLRSGGRDLLIDKIRHLSYLLRNGTKETNNKLGVVCNDLKDR